MTISFLLINFTELSSSRKPVYGQMVSILSLMNSLSGNVSNILNILLLHGSSLGHILSECAGIEPSKKEVAAKPSTFSFGFQPKDNDRASEEAEEPAKDEADTDEADTDKIEKAANGMEEKKTSKAQPVTTPEA